MNNGFIIKTKLDILNSLYSVLIFDDPPSKHNYLLIWPENPERMKLKAGRSTEIINCDTLILKYNKYTVFF